MFDPNTPEVKNYVNQKLKEQAEQIAEKILDNVYPVSYVDVEKCTGLSRQDIERVLDRRRFKTNYRHGYQIGTLLIRVWLLYNAIKNPDDGITLEQAIEYGSVNRERLDLEAWKAEPEKWAIAELRLQDASGYDIMKQLKLSEKEYYYTYYPNSEEYNSYRCKQAFEEIFPDEENVEWAYQEYLRKGSVGNIL